MIDQWAGVRERVAALGALPASSQVFGGFGHRWALEEPLTEEELATLEDQIGVRLPEEYRTFLRHVAAGGAGPAYGLFPVRRAQDRWRWEGDGADLADLSLLAEPFPARGPDPARLDELRARSPEEEDFAESDDFDDALEAWDEEWYALAYAPELTAGAVVVCHLGCAQREWLVLSGIHRGTIWSDGRADEGDVTPLLDGDGKPVTFGRWYTGWLEEAERLVLPSTTEA
ncbi:MULTISPECIES: SMI1/KNR4 family protein [unclassified Streptomyces]|uniref:SMI1/KNR4 family protein n=1 Tax=unclassified Streptomyces TaxID=2593676 RepID=UPI0006F4DCD8|nr:MULTISPECIES: SMI1/KNR4 family protein [unclassified Streptomyces]KQX59547.1 cell wall assembly protein [Streptomyces sp. Root1304]KRB00805.1 cell wall assembly protein [Streptomyces sp. Root66D1]